MQTNWVETLIGAIVIVLAIGFIVYGYSVTEPESGEHYTIIAEFDRVNGVTIGSDVRMAGIKIGVVSKLTLNPATYRAVLEMNLQEGIALPDDSSARITSDGLLGNNYIALTGGGSESFLSAGDRLLFTQGAIDLIGLVGQALFSPESKDATE